MRGSQDGKGCPESGQPKAERFGGQEGSVGRKSKAYTSPVGISPSNLVSESLPNSPASDAHVHFFQLLQVLFQSR